MKKEIIKTTKCENFNHPEFEICYDSDLIIKPDVEWLIEFLENQVRLGEVFEDNDTIQIGWMLSLLKRNNKGIFEILEPDMQSLPIQWIKSVNTTLRHLRLQKDTAESLKLDHMIEFANIRSSAIVGKYFETSKTIVMERTVEEGNDSGWFIGSAEHDIDYNDQKNLSQISLYELGCQRPDIVMYLALPPNINIIAGENLLEVKFQGEKIFPYPQSFLDRIINNNTSS
jgi:hypothetical protein